MKKYGKTIAYLLELKTMSFLRKIRLQLALLKNITLPLLFRIHHRAYSLKEEMPWPPCVGEEITQLIQTYLHKQNHAYYPVRVFNEVFRIALENGFKVSHGRVLEIGPGANMGTSLCMVFSGVSKMVAIDINKDIVNYDSCKSILEYAKVATGIGWYRGKELTKRKDISWRIPDVSVDEAIKRTEYIAPCSVSSIPKPDKSFNLIYSCAVLEHVDEPLEAIREISRVSELGAVHIHEIDMSNHGPGGPLDHYKYSDSEWRNITTKYDSEHGISKILSSKWKSIPYCNRLSAEKWQNIFYESGLSPINVEIIAKATDSSYNPKTLAPKFQGITENEIKNIVIRITALKTN